MILKRISMVQIGEHFYSAFEPPKGNAIFPAGTYVYTRTSEPLPTEMRFFPRELTVPPAEPPGDDTVAIASPV